jgi:hypothetical protein
MLWPATYAGFASPMVVVTTFVGSLLPLIEGERRRITLDDAWALCRGLGVRLPDLLAGTPREGRREMGL